MDRKSEIQMFLEYTSQAGEIELNDILDAAQMRYAKLFPDWDIMYLALPKKTDPEKRKECLESVIDYLRNRP